MIAGLSFEKRSYQGHSVLFIIPPQVCQKRTWIGHHQWHVF